MRAYLTASSSAWPPSRHLARVERVGLSHEPEMEAPLMISLKLGLAGAGPFLSIIGAYYS